MTAGGKEGSVDWGSFYDRLGDPDARKFLESPDEWQIRIAERTRSSAGNGSVLEAGCGFGLTSYLVGEGARRFLLDLDPRAIRHARSLFSAGGQAARFLVADLFRLPFEDCAFEVVFNAGVVEHFPFAARREALLEMIRVAKVGGTIIIAFPNHYSLPYRYSYLYRKKHGTWAYPDEESIFDFKEEAAGIGSVVPLGRETVAMKTSFHFLSRCQRLMFKFRNLFGRYEGYLTIVAFQKVPEKSG